MLIFEIEAIEEGMDPDKLFEPQSLFIINSKSYIEVTIDPDDTTPGISHPSVTVVSPFMAL